MGLRGGLARAGAATTTNRSWTTIRAAGVALGLIGAGLAGCGGDDAPGGTGTSGSGGGGGGGGTTTSTTTGGTTCTPGEARACYSGPQGTQGVGPCMGGTETCNADGTAFGECAGEIVPSTEICFGGSDEDCDGAIDNEGEGGSLCGVFGWSKRFGDGGTQKGMRVATDAAGDVILAGRYTGDVDLGGGALGNAGQNDVFVAKLDAAGNHLWSRRFGGAGDEALGDIAVDSVGNVLVTGSFNGTVDFGDGPLVSAGGKDGFLVKLDPAGATLWSKQIGGASGQEGVGVAAAAQGDIVLLGTFYGSIDLGGGALSNVDSLTDIFLARLTAAGDHVWSKSFGGPDWHVATDVAVDAAGGVVFGGNFQGDINLGGQTFSRAPGGLTNADIFLAKLDGGGNHVWSRAFLDDHDDPAFFEIATDAGGAVVVAGGARGTLDFGAGPLVAAGNTDAFIVKLDAAGDAVWSQRFGGGSNQQFGGVAVDAAGNVVTTGFYWGSDTMDVGSGPLPGGFQATSLIVAKWNAAGQLVWARPTVSQYDTQGVGVAVDGQGAVFVTGDTEGGVNFGDAQLPSLGADDVFLVRYTP